MCKRKNLEHLPQEQDDLKRLNKIKIMPKMNFLFIIKKEHSKFYSPGGIDAFEAQHLLPIEIVTVKVTQKEFPSIFKYSETTLRKYLKNFFKNKFEDHIEIQEIQRKDKESEQQNNMTVEKNIKYKGRVNLSVV